VPLDELMRLVATGTVRRPPAEADVRPAHDDHDDHDDHDMSDGHDEPVAAR
jgi:hypothetical protein